MDNEDTVDNSLVELVEIFNQSPTSDDILIDCLSQLNVVAANDNNKFILVCRNMNVDLLFNIILIGKFSSTNTTKQIVSSSCDLLARIFANSSSIEVIEKYRSYVAGSMDLDYEQFQILCLQQIFRLADEDKFSYFMSSPDLIQITIKFLCKENLKTTRIARKILKKLIDLSGNGWLFSDDFVKLFHELLSSKNSVIKFRIYEIFVNYVTKYPEYMEACKSSKIFDSLLQILHGNDILSQLNALEMVSQIAISGPQGLDFVQENGVMEWVNNIFAETDDPLISFLLPGAVKFFGVLCSANPLEIIPQYKHVMVKIFENVNSDDSSMRSLCAETIAFICWKNEGLKMLYSQFDGLKDIIKLMTRIISNLAEDEHARKKTIQSLAAIFNHDSHDIEVSNICEKLYRHIDADPLHFLFSLCKKPFMELRYGSLTLLYNVSKYNWVEQDMVLCAGFMEYLLDRSTESEKEGRELKYTIIKNLSTSATAKENFGVNYHEKLQKYAGEGAFYAESRVEVTYEQEG